jgi:hypothetical protein
MFAMIIDLSAMGGRIRLRTYSLLMMLFIPSFIYFIFYIFAEFEGGEKKNERK